MKIIEKPKTLVSCHCCDTKLELEPEDIRPITGLGSSLFKGYFICPVCHYENYIVPGTNKCV